MMRILRNVLLFLLIPTTAGILFFRYTPLALDGVSLQRDDACATPLTEESSLKRTPQPAGIRISHEENCAATMQKPAVQRIGSHLFVRLHFSYPDELAGCICSHRALITGGELTAGNPKVHVYVWP